MNGIARVVMVGDMLLPILYVYVPNTLFLRPDPAAIAAVVAWIREGVL